MNQLNFPILSLITYIPVIGALIIILFSRFIKDREKENKFIMNFAFIVLLIDFVISLLLVFKFETGLDTSRFKTKLLMEQFSENVPWIKSIGVHYHMGIDGISLWLVMLTTFTGAISVLCSFSAIKERIKEYYVMMLILQTGMLGVFIALDFFLFYLFWEVMLVPMYFLIGVWGGPNKLYAAIKFFLYTLFGSVLMLLGILAIYFITGAKTFDIVDLMAYLEMFPLPTNIRWWIFSIQDLVFLAFFIGFAIKVPMFPFHTWLPDAHVEAPTAGSVILAGVLLKMGTYGFIRFSIPMLPEATIKFVPMMITLSIIGIIYGALVAMLQKDWKKLVAYSSVSHLGFVMLGLFALNSQGIQGGILQMVNHGLSTGALFLIVGIIYERRHTRMISDFGGLSHIIPVFAVFFLITTLSSIGLPGLNGFVGEFLILVGAFRANWMWALLASTGIVLGAAYMLWLYQRTMFGKLENPENKHLTDLNKREWAYLLPIVIMMFWIGLYPTPFLKRMEDSVKPIVKRIERIDPRFNKKLWYEKEYNKEEHSKVQHNKNETGKNENNKEHPTEVEDAHQPTEAGKR